MERLETMLLSRRSLMAGGAAVAAVAGAGKAQQPPAAGPGIPGTPATVITTEFQQLSPTCYAFLQREAPGQSNLSVSNFGLVEGPSSLLAIDAGGGPQHARNFLAAAATLNKPVDRVVISHEHPDHIVGLAQFPEGVEIVAQEETRKRMVEMGTPATPAYWATNTAWALPTDVNRILLPTVTYKDRMSVYYGDTQVDFIWPGPAHTSGDTLVLLPAERILFMGDIGFFEVAPLFISGFVSDWLKVCNDILDDPNVETIVPGHGPVGGKAELADMRDYLVLLSTEGRKTYDAGVSPGRAAAELDLGKYATWSDADRVAPNMARLYAEFAGTIGTAVDRGAAGAALAEYRELTGQN